MNDFEKPRAIEAIKQTKACYFLFLNTRILREFLRDFAVDAAMDMLVESQDGSGLVQGNRQIAEFILNSGGWNYYRASRTHAGNRTRLADEDAWNLGR